MKSDQKSKVVKEYLRKYPQMSIRGVAEKIYSENKLLFKDYEEARYKVRYFKGSAGAIALKRVSPEFLTQAARMKKYNLPESIETEYEPYPIHGTKGLICSDIHIPFQDNKAISIMLEYAQEKKIDFIILNGDIMDCFDISYFSHEPDLITFQSERDKTVQFLKELKNVFPKAKIYYKFANHEDRWEKYLMQKAPEIFGMPEFRLDVLLGLHTLGIENIPSDRYIVLNGELKIWHGHEYKNAITSPASPARTAFLRAKESTIIGHYHQTSEHTEPTISGKIITSWSLGCMCGLHPKYMPLNKWNLGFAIYEKHKDDFWIVENKRIVKGRIV